MNSFSIIICTYNRVTFLEETIDSILLAIKGLTDIELILIDNNSTDGTAKLVEKYKHISFFKYYLEKEQGLSNARNRGMKEARGDIFIFLDDDIELNSEYFEECRTTFRDKHINIVGGKVLPHKIKIPKWLPKKYYYLVSIFDLGDVQIITDTLMGANYAMRKALADQVGLYNPDLGRKGDNLMGGEENDYLDRAKLLGYNVNYNPNLIVMHKINNKLNKKYVFDHSYLNGRSNSIIHKKYNKIKYLLKIFKACIMIGVYYVFGFYQPTDRVRTYFKINRYYSLGYLEGLYSNI